MTDSAEFYAIVGPDVDGYLPTAQYVDLRGQRYLRSADLKWLLWRDAYGDRPGHWELVYTVHETGTPMFGSSLSWTCGGRPVNVNEPVLPVTLVDRSASVPVPTATEEPKQP